MNKEEIIRELKGQLHSCSTAIKKCMNQDDYFGKGYRAGYNLLAEAIQKLIDKEGVN